MLSFGQTDRQMDTGKTICTRSFHAGHKKVTTINNKSQVHDSNFAGIFPQGFLSFQRTAPFSSNLKLLSANSLSLEKFEICRLEKC